MKKQRWRWTKIPKKHLDRYFCSGCGKRLDTRDKYAMRYGFCDVYCGYTTYGLSARDFY
jgi:ribosomal protein L37AE/L43A